MFYKLKVVIYLVENVIIFIHFFMILIIPYFTIIENLNFLLLH